MTFRVMFLDDEVKPIHAKFNYYHDKCTFNFMKDEFNDINVNLMGSLPLKNGKYMLTYENIYPVNSWKDARLIISRVKSNPFTISINEQILQSKTLILGFIELADNSPFKVAQSLGLIRYKEFTREGNETISIVTSKMNYDALMNILSESGDVSDISLIQITKQFFNFRLQLSGMQKTVFEKAIEMGFFKNPKGAYLKDIAKEVGISIVSVSEYLREAEKKLASSYLEE